MEKRIVKCPQCKNDSVYSPENPYRPFCSERCRLIDLGEWATESYRVPDKEKVSIQELGNDSDNDAENE